MPGILTIQGTVDSQQQRRIGKAPSMDRMIPLSEDVAVYEVVRVRHTERAKYRYQHGRYVRTAGVNPIPEF